MKTIFPSITALTCICVALVGCGPKISPDETAEIYQKHLCAGEAEKAREMLEPGLRKLYGEAMALELLQGEAQACQAKGGIKSFEIQNKQDISESRMLFKVAIEYGKGMKERIEMAMRPIDGKWYLSAH